MAGEMEDDEEYDIKFREDEELEFFTELAVHETERWIQAVTKKRFQFPEDPRKSLENGVLLCELANCLQPGAIRRINRLSTPIAGLDNVNVFLKACTAKFHLNDSQLFNPSDLEDLSQRAIGETDRLKEEYDKRLRNVAVTVYWLGRYAASNYQGPQLDQSAFSALVHHKHDAEILERDFRHSSSSSNWDWGHVGPGSRASGQHNAKDGSVDSFGKESIDSLEDSISQTHYSNTSAAARSSDRDFSASHPSNRPDSMSHRRYSSTDSLNGSAHSGHSRQDSDSNEPGYPTRRMSAQMTRKSSTSADPLQFVKDDDYEDDGDFEEDGAGKTAADLAEMAEVQMRIAAESKKIASETKVYEEEDSIDWQANLSTWKNRRKSQSERSYQLKEDLERMEKEKETEQTSILTTKTFSQMQEDRERRKSVSRHFYPINDDEEDDIFPSRKETDIEKAKAEVFQSMHKPKAEVAPWARDSPEDQSKDDEQGKEDDSDSDQDDINNNDKDNAITPTKNNSSLYSSSSRDWKSQDSDQFIQRTQTTQQNRSPSHLRQSYGESQRNDGFKSSGTNVGPRTQSKIGSLMQNFQQSSNKTSQPKEGYKESINLSARKNIFEQYSDEPPAEKTRDAQQYSDSRWNQSNRFNGRDQGDSQLSTSGTSDDRSSPASRDDEGDDKLIQVEKTIKISQKPNNDKGFGFFLTGGADQGRPLCVSKVSLGSAADLCELKVKDEILRVNQTDASGKTAGEVGDIIGRAVNTGFIELRVKRTCTADELEEEEDEDMTSSSDEGEEDLSSFDRNGRKAEPASISSGQEDRQKVTPVNNEMANSDGNVRSRFSAPSPQNTEGSVKDEDDGPPAILRKWQRQRQREEYTFDGGPSTDYKKISLNAAIPRQEISNDRMEMSQDTSLSVSHSKPNMSWDDRLSEWTTKQDKDREPDLLHATSQGAHEQARFESRQEEMKMAYEESINEADKKADEHMKQEQSFLQPELEKARILEERRMERRNRIQETAAALSSQPQVTSSSLSSSFTSLPLPSSFLPSSSSSTSPSSVRKRWQSPKSDSINSSSPIPFHPPTSGSHVTSMTFDIGAKSDDSTPVSYAFPKQQGVIVIDPRNQAEKQSAITPVEFQVKLAPKQDIDQSLLEAERERIRQEERKKVEEERLAAQKEWEAKQEEVRKIEEKERELREKEEMLRQEREKFLREQEEFKRIREQQMKEQQQMQYHEEHSQQPPPIPELPQFEQQQYQPQHQTPPQSSVPLYQNLYPNSQQFQNYHQHFSQSKQPSPNTLDPNMSSQHSQASSGSPTYYQSTTNTSHSPQPKSSWSNSQPERSQGYRLGNNSGYSQVQPPMPSDQDRYHRGEHFTGARFSREDILAMNRKATPDRDLSRRSPENHIQQQQHQPQYQHPHHHQQQFQQQQYQPQQQQQQRVHSPVAKDGGQPKAHALNSAPKARLRDDKEWQDPSRQAARMPRGRDDVNPLRRSPYGNSQEHWLVQEAERRRLAESDSRLRGQAPVNPGQVLYPGPIKPQGDDMGNRWRNNTDSTPSMPHAIRQTLLQKTSTTRGPDNGSSHYPSEPPYQQQQVYQQQHQHPNSLLPRGNNHYYPGSQDQQHKGHPYMANDPMNRYSPNSGHSPTNLQHGPPPRQPPPPTNSDGLPVNGNQLCSHCNQELGFGAAMVIESLGIFFHLQCFRCCVCHASLGTGSQGADVRVRMNKLHCPNCYSNDEAGLKFSKV